MNWLDYDNKGVGLINNSSIGFEFVEECFDNYPEISSDMDIVSQCNSITPDFIERHIDLDWNWGESGLSCNISITPEFIEKYIHKPWVYGYGGLSQYHKVTITFIQDHINEDWYWEGIDDGQLEGGLSSNSFVTEDIIVYFIDKPWHWFNNGSGLTNNVNLSLSFFEKYLPYVKNEDGYPYDITYLSCYQCTI